MMKKYILTLVVGCLASIKLMAVTITVSNANDGGAGSLRQALTTAAAGDVVQIDVTGPIALLSDLPTISKAITVNGSANTTTISGNNQYRIFTVQIASGTVSLNNLHITNGFSSIGAAPGLYAITGGTGSVAVTRCTFSGCANTGSQAYGGAIATSADLSLVNCTFYGNTAQLGGGALATLSNCAVSVNACTVYANQSVATAGGGGFDLYGATVATVQNTILAGNYAGTSTSYSDVKLSGGAILTSLGNNLSNTAPFAHASDLVNKNLSTQIKLQPLANYGAMVCAIQGGSLAIDAGNSSSAPVADQRFQARVGLPDIGAYEFVPSLSVSTNSVNIAAAANSTAQFTITSNATWEVSDNADWLQPGVTTGLGNANVVLTALSLNNTGAVRSAIVTVKSANLPDQTITVTQASSVPMSVNQVLSRLVLYPNPCVKGFNIEVGNIETELTVLDITGHVVIKQMVSGLAYVPVDGLKAGVYLVRVNGLITKLQVKK